MDADLEQAAAARKMGVALPGVREGLLAHGAVDGLRWADSSHAGLEGADGGAVAKRVGHHEGQAGLGEGVADGAGGLGRGGQRFFDQKRLARPGHEAGHGSVEARGDGQADGLDGRVGDQVPPVAVVGAPELRRQASARLGVPSGDGSQRRPADACGKVAGVALAVAANADEPYGEGSAHWVRCLGFRCNGPANSMV